MPKHLHQRTQRPTKQTNTRYGNMLIFEDDTTIGRSLELYGEYCHPEVEAILQFVNQESCFVDIGANIGTHTCGVSPHVAQTFAFEPDQDNFYMLNANCGLTQQQGVVPTKLALSNTNAMGSTQFDYGKTTVVAGNDFHITTLDNIQLPQCDFIKIDVEGFELEVLEGAQQTITRFKPSMLIEMQEPERQKLVYNFLREKQYNLYWFLVPTFNKYNHKGNEEDVFGSQHGVVNWIASTYSIKELHSVVDEDDTVQRMIRRRSEQDGIA